MPIRDYTFLGTTKSLCPQCHRLVDAKIIVREHEFSKSAVPSTARTTISSAPTSPGSTATEFRPARAMAALLFGVDARPRLSLRLRPVHRTRAAHLPRSGRDHVVVQPELSDVLRLQRAWRQAPELRRLQGGHRSAGAGRRKGRGAATLRRRTDHPPRVSAHPRVRLLMCRGPGDDQLQRPAVRPRSAVPRGRRPLPPPLRSLSPVRRLRPGDAPHPPRQGPAGNQAHGPGSSAEARYPLDAGLHRRRPDEPARGRRRAAIRTGSARRAQHQLPSWPPTAAGTSAPTTWNAGPPCPTWSRPWRRSPTACWARRISTRCPALIRTAT